MPYADPEVRRRYVRDHARKWRASHPHYRETQRRSRYKTQFGITVEAYDALLSEQGGRCALCGREDWRRLAIDHDHETGAVRGLLCSPCNLGLGQLGDNIERLQAAIEYLRRTTPCL